MGQIRITAKPRHIAVSLASGNGLRAAAGHGKGIAGIHGQVKRFDRVGYIARINFNRPGHALVIAGSTKHIALRIISIIQT